MRELRAHSEIHSEMDASPSLVSELAGRRPPRPVWSAVPAVSGSSQRSLRADTAAVQAQVVALEASAELMRLMWRLGGSASWRADELGLLVDVGVVEWIARTALPIVIVLVTVSMCVAAVR